MADTESSHPKNIHTPTIQPTKFKDWVVVVTGAASGIGRETAQHFATQGAQTILLDINGPGLEKTQSSIRESGGKAANRPCDVSNENDVNAAIEWTIQTYTKIDVLVNLAGIYGFQPLTEYSTELYNRHISINVNGSFFLTRAVLPHMQKAGFGRIIHTSSTTYASPKPGLSAYVMSKAAVVGLVRSAAVEAGPGVTVNAMMPGLIDTDEMRSKDGYEVIREKILESRAVKRDGKPIDVARTIAFIASPEAGFMSGQVVDCSGGETFSF
ncbi:hypothetical protein BDW74DRAFT_160497 [Aspergillus multicolor]|uniref:SDR family NAD(P)-dependent oxidoreductase n=1 Tax=Aspergillus multicolor TaxID=41759 RepID=UPI003CCE1D24